MPHSFIYALIYVNRLEWKVLNEVLSKDGKIVQFPLNCLNTNLELLETYVRK